MSYEKQILTHGDGKTFPEKNDILTTHYTGMLKANGKKFDSSIDKGKPFRFTIWKGTVIRGWDEVLMTMSLGEKAKVVISSDWAYGEAGVGDAIPPNSDLVFIIELLKIQRDPFKRKK